MPSFAEPRPRATLSDDEASAADALRWCSCATPTSAWPATNDRGQHQAADDRHPRALDEGRHRDTHAHVLRDRLRRPLRNGTRAPTSKPNITRKPAATSRHARTAPSCPHPRPGPRGPGDQQAAERRITPRRAMQDRADHLHLPAIDLRCCDNGTFAYACGSSRSDAAAAAELRASLENRCSGRPFPSPRNASARDRATADLARKRLRGTAGTDAEGVASCVSCGVSVGMCLSFQPSSLNPGPCLTTRSMERRWLSRFPGVRVVALSGRDAIAFAQSQFMNDVATLADGHWQWSGWLDPKGGSRRCSRCCASMPKRSGWSPTAAPTSKRRSVASSSAARYASRHWTCTPAACSRRQSVPRRGRMARGGAGGTRFLGDAGARRTLRLSPNASERSSPAEGAWWGLGVAHGWPALPGVRLAELDAAAALATAPGRLQREERLLSRQGSLPVRISLGGPSAG